MGTSITKEKAEESFKVTKNIGNTLFAHLYDQFRLKANNLEALMEQYGRPANFLRYEEEWVSVRNQVQTSLKILDLIENSGLSQAAELNNSRVSFDFSNDIMISDSLLLEYESLTGIDLETVYPNALLFTQMIYDQKQLILSEAIKKLSLIRENLPIPASSYITFMVKKSENQTLKIRHFNKIEKFSKVRINGKESEMPDGLYRLPFSKWQDMQSPLSLELHLYDTVFKYVVRPDQVSFEH